MVVLEVVAQPPHPDRPGSLGRLWTAGATSLSQ